MNRPLLTCLLAGAAMTASPALAQVAPPLEDLVAQGEILNRSVLEAASPAGPGGAASSDELAGEAGLYVLTVNEIFFLSGTLGGGYASNPTRTSGPKDGDQHLDAGVSLGMSTRLGGVTDVGAALNLDLREYEKTDSASSRSISANVSAGRSLFGRVYAGAVAFGGRSYDKDLGQSTGFYGLSASLSAPVKLSDRLLLRPGVGLTQQWSQVSENDSFTASIAADAVYVVAPKWTLSGRVSASKRVYRDFYEDVTFIEREDELLGVSAALTWRPRPDVAVSASVGYEDQGSTLFLSEFNALDSGVNLGLRKTF